MPRKKKQGGVPKATKFTTKNVFEVIEHLEKHNLVPITDESLRIERIVQPLEPGMKRWCVKMLVDKERSLAEIQTRREAVLAGTFVVEEWQQLVVPVVERSAYYAIKKARAEVAPFCVSLDFDPASIIITDVKEL